MHTLLLLMLLLLRINGGAYVSRVAARLLALGAGWVDITNLIATRQQPAYQLPAYCLFSLLGIGSWHSGRLAYWGHTGGYRDIVSGILATGCPRLDDLGTTRLLTPLNNRPLEWLIISDLFNFSRASRRYYGRVPIPSMAINTSKGKHNVTSLLGQVARE
jgi:hypothetical protein